MRIAFRTDASLTIGNGHVMRCVSLAQVLRAQGAQCIFICSQASGSLNGYLQALNFELIQLESEHLDTRKSAESLMPNWQDDARATVQALAHSHVDWLIVDHYGLEQQWESLVSVHVPRLMVIDDLANRQHHCHLLLDANPGRLAEDYAGLIPEACRILTGPQYALIREEIRSARTSPPVQKNTETTLKLLVTLGGVDKDNITSKVLATLNDFESEVALNIQVVAGPFAPWIDTVITTSRAMRWPTRVAQNPSHFVEWMCTHDVAIGAAGTSALERCYLGLPSINFVLAPNQKTAAHALTEVHAAGLLELNQDWEKSLHQQLHKLLKPDLRQAMQEACTRVTDGRGADRVTQEIWHA